ncbi:MAG: CinA family nicotinamide mononucleotide deamidase-related protein [Phycisphaerales bacterium]|nr:CinA family nicotinamide mononucleotide deamidase-related protein [Phycisphaerales bacterium]
MDCGSSGQAKNGLSAAIISVGDELMLGQTQDTNAKWLASQFTLRGVVTREFRTVHDDLVAIESVLRELSARHDILVMTGGLGPTEDDLTREALRRAMDVVEPLEVDAQALAALDRWFIDRGRPMSANNAVQALRPKGARCLQNIVGTAPGLHANIGRAQIWCLPGPPLEMESMFETEVAPHLPHAVMSTAAVHSFGYGESFLAEILGARMARQRNPLIGTTASGSIVTARIRGVDAQAHSAAMESSIQEIEKLWAPYAFGRDQETLAGALGKLLVLRGERVSLAESCTGGLAASMVTAESGSSAWFAGGAVTYANGAKIDLLQVPHELLAAHGAVSAPVARAMARGCAALLKTQWAASITGIAGPSGGTDAKPVGEVFIGICGPRFEGVKKFRYPGDRASIRDRAAKSALALLRFALLGPEAFASAMIWEWNK